MKTKIIKIDITKPLDEQLEFPVEVIKSGGLVAFPTETVYGLGASALNEDASKNIYKAKGRPSDNPLIIHIDNPIEAEKYCFTNDDYHKIAKNFMPGPITCILKKKNIIPNTITGGLDTVAVRCPENIIANKLIQLCGCPIAAPSANTSGKPSPTKAQHVIDDLYGKIDCIIDGGSCDIGLESTIVKIVDGNCKLLRPGGITINQLTSLFPKIEIDKAVISKLNENEIAEAPGMKYRHYAPKALVNLILKDGTNEQYGRIINYLSKNTQSNNIGVLASDDIVSKFPNLITKSLGPQDDEFEQGRRLFDCLREFDKTNVEMIYVVINQKNNDLGLAIYNRMLKASGFNILKI